MKTEFKREELKEAFTKLKREISNNEIEAYQYTAEDIPEGRFVKIELLIKTESK